jgi:regulator of protease activity HflC (stomatin/prohibitin superfamily)
VKAVYEIENLPSAIMDVTLNALRANIGKLTLNQILSERQSVNQRIAAELLDTTNRWGVSISRVEIQEISYNKETEDAMLQQISADRKKMALISEAEGEAQAIKLKAVAQSEATRLIADSEKYYLQQIGSLSDSTSAIRALIAQKYIQGMDVISQNPGHKVFIPNNFMALYDTKKADNE